MSRPHATPQAMKVEVDFQSGKNSSGIFVHRYLSQSMGYSVAAFACAVLAGHTGPGVWYPEVGLSARVVIDEMLGRWSA